MIRGIYEDGVFKPFDPVDMPEGTYVQLHAVPVMPVNDSNTPEQKLTAIFAILVEEQQRAQLDQAAKRLEYRPEA